MDDVDALPLDQARQPADIAGHGQRVLGGRGKGVEFAAQRLQCADEAAALIPAGAHVGMSGFTGAGYPKAVPGALGGIQVFLSPRP